MEKLGDKWEKDKLNRKADAVFLSEYLAGADIFFKKLG